MHTGIEPRISVYPYIVQLATCVRVRPFLVRPSCTRVGRDTSPCTQAVHFKYTASQSVNSESDLSLRGPESTAWCTMVPTSGSLRCPMLQFVPCFQGAWGDGNRPGVHGHPWSLIGGLTVLSFFSFPFLSFSSHRHSHDRSIVNHSETV